MRLGILVARRVTPALSQTPRRCFARPCVPTLLIPRHQRLLHAGPGAPEAELDTTNNDKATEADSKEHAGPGAPEAELDTNNDKATEVDSKEPSSQNQDKDSTWVFDYAGRRIGALDGEVSTDSYQEYVTHESGAKLISSWSVSPGDEPVMWVPGDAPRLKDLKLPVTLEPEMLTSETPSGKWSWSMGSPQSSFEPFFASLAAMNPRVKFDNTDVIARATELQMLAGVARGNFSKFGAGSRALGFQFQVVKNTLLVKKLLNTKRSGLTLGRGMTPTLQGSFFNKITEMPPSEKHVSPDHYQAMRYDLGPLHCVAISAVDAATGDDTLPPVKVFDTSSLIPKGSNFVDVRRGGRGVAPAAVTVIHTSVTDREGWNQPISDRGNIKLQTGKMLKMWLQRPASVVQGHCQRGLVPPGASEEAAQLTRISVRDTKIIFETVEDIWVFYFRRLVVFLQQLRETARKAGGPCILTYQPPIRTHTGGPIIEPAKFEIYEATPEAPPIVLDWHVKQFWSKD